MPIVKAAKMKPIERAEGAAAEIAADEEAEHVDLGADREAKQDGGEERRRSHRHRCRRSETPKTGSSITTAEKIGPCT